MANLNRPRGFEPKGAKLRVNKYIAYSAIYPGDMVQWDGSHAGYVIPASGGATDKLLGCALSYASGQDVSVEVCDDPNQLYIVQADSTEVDNADDVGKYCEVKATAGDSTFKISRQEIDTVATTDTKPLRIVEIDTNPGNAVGDSCQVVVQINVKALVA